MRALFDPEVEFENNEAVIGPPHVHHLHNVIRIQPGEKLLLIDGRGKQTITEVIASSKKEIALKKIEELFFQDQRQVDLLLAPPKKDTFHEILKISVELDIKSIYLADTHYSQRFPYKKEKIEKIVQGAYEQSNSAFEIEIIESNSLLNMKPLLESYDHVLYFSTMSDNEGESKLWEPLLSEKILVVVGPEGGFSSDEHQFFLALDKVHEIRLQTNILRSQTAVSAALGYVHGKLLLPRS